MITKLFREFTRKDILSGIDKSFINHGRYTKDLKSKIGQAGIKSKNWFLDKIIGSTLYFKIRSATKKNEFYDNKISFKDSYDWLRKNFNFGGYDISTLEGKSKLVNDLKFYFRSAIDTDDILINCNCPAYKFWGYNYQATQLDYNTRKNKENRPADIRNPNDRGSVCKHLNVTLANISDNRIKPFIVEYLVDDFLTHEVRRRYKKDIGTWWRGYFTHIKKLIR